MGTSTTSFFRYIPLRKFFHAEYIKLHKHILPVGADESVVVLLLCRPLVSWICKDGESWAAANPSLVTFEKDFLSPATGGLEEIDEFPRAEQNTQITYTMSQHCPSMIHHIAQNHKLHIPYHNTAVMKSKTEEGKASVRWWKLTPVTQVQHA